jgi:hypothetical protein
LWNSACALCRFAAWGPRELEVYLLLLSWNTARVVDMGGQNVDAMLCSVQTGTQEGQASRSHSLRMRLGVVAKTAIVIEYYLPQKFPKQSENLMPPAPRGRIIPFPALDSNSVPTLFRLAWLPVFDFGLPNRHKFIFDFMGEDALSSKARFWLRQFDAVSDCKACPYPPVISS